jgi:hypothetical protein
MTEESSESFDFIKKLNPHYKIIDERLNLNNMKITIKINTFEDFGLQNDINISSLYNK